MASAVCLGRGDGCDGAVGVVCPVLAFFYVKPGSVWGCFGAEGSRVSALLVVGIGVWSSFPSCSGVLLVVRLAISCYIGVCDLRHVVWSAGPAECW